jgi:beta-lactamase class D
MVRSGGVRRSVLAALLAGIYAAAAPAASFKEVPELGKVFSDHGVSGTFVLFDVGADKMFVWNKERAQLRFTPASTFKIANSLIGLEVGAVKDVEEVLPYGGKPQRVKAWEKDMGLREAIKISNVPIYQELARRIGLERMRKGVRRLGYGNMEIGNVVDRFWLDGPLAISAVEQTQFLDRLTSGKLPIKSSVVEVVEKITQIEKTDHYVLHGKTGWFVSKTNQLGWWVGWIEREGKTYSFALNFDILNDKDAEQRVPIGKECLKIMGKL